MGGDLFTLLRQMDLEEFKKEDQTNIHILKIRECFENIKKIYAGKLN